MIPFQSQIISALGGMMLAAWITASVLNLKYDHALDKIKLDSQAVAAQAAQTVISKTETANTITVDNSAQLQKDLNEANTKISSLQRGIANGTIGMRLPTKAVSCSGSGVQSSPNTTAVPETATVELDPKVASELLDIAAQGDQNARYYNSLRNWCEAQLSLQSGAKE